MKYKTWWTLGILEDDAANIDGVRVEYYWSSSGEFTYSFQLFSYKSNNFSKVGAYIF